MLLEALLMSVFAVVCCGGVTSLVLRASMKGHRQRNAAVERSDAAFREVGAALGLAFLEGETERYSVIGALRTFGRLRGRLHGVDVRVDVSFDSPGSGAVHFCTVVSAELSARAGVVDAGALRQMEAAFPNTDLELTEGRLVLGARDAWSASLGQYTFALIDDPQRLREVVDRLALYASEGRSVYRA